MTAMVFSDWIAESMLDLLSVSIKITRRTAVTISRPGGVIKMSVAKRRVCWQAGGPQTVQMHGRTTPTPLAAF